MIDDRPGLQEPRFHGPEPEGRDEARGPAAFAPRQPAVSIVIKRRRGTPAPGTSTPGPDASAAAHERRPRVYQVNAAPSPSEPVAERLPESVSVEATPTAAAQTTARRRARRDPLRAPGQVTRTVFETPAPPPDPQPQAAPGEPALPPHGMGFIERPEIGYEQVMAELRQLRAQIDAALGARKFRIG